ncbi:MAG: carboxypeptidase regulatory-like domain-containing protein [Planctomycetales bacterium]|nr:carboxypeptidase regulatory-like domain-containing protein [Planctomycetales bacterium]
MVRLTSEGSVDGRIRVTYPTGKTEPLGAKVSFAKNGEVVESTETDESGRFRLAGLNPGDYVATADAMTGTHADFDVRVLPFNEGALAEEMFLDATLTPLPGYVGEGCATCGEEVIVDEVVMDGGEFCGEAIVEDYAMAAPMGIAGDCGATCGGGFAGGGCCGGARGFGWLGLAGLAGLAGLGGKDSTPVSPYSHHYRGY